MNRDKYGIIGQIQPNGSIEGGDSANWMGHYIYLTKDNFPFVETFEVAPGAYVRHPDPKQTNNGFGAHYKNPYNGCISRDQLTGIIAGLVAQKEYKALLRLILHILLRLGLFSYNTIHNGRDPKQTRFNLLKLFYNPTKENYYKLPDLTLFNIWGMLLRGFGVLSYLLYPLLCILDVQLLIDTIVINRSKDNDKINYAIRMIVAKERVPTLVSKLAWKLLNKSSLLASIKDYWCGWRDNCDMYKLYKNKLIG